MGFGKHRGALNPWVAVCHMSWARGWVLAREPDAENRQPRLGWDEQRMLKMMAGLSERRTEPAKHLGRLATMIEERADTRLLLTDVTEETADRLDEVDREAFDAFESYRWSASGFRALSRDVADPTLADQPTLLLKLLSNQIEAGFAPSALDAAKEGRRAELVGGGIVDSLRPPFVASRKP